jgi:hypothetical protein
VNGNQKKISIDEAHMNQTIIANYTYAIPTVSAAGYKASLDASKALKLFKTQYGTRTQFTRNDFVNTMINDHVSNIFQWDLYNFEGDLSDDLKAVLKTDVASRLTDKFMKSLQDLNLVQGAPPALTVPDPGNVNEVQTRRECHSSGGFFGLFSSSSCYDVPYTVQVAHAGEGELTVKDNEILKMKFEEAVEINGIIHRKGTSSFKLAPQTSDFNGYL